MVARGRPQGAVTTLPITASIAPSSSCAASLRRRIVIIRSLALELETDVPVPDRYRYRYRHRYRFRHRFRIRSRSLACACFSCRRQSVRFSGWLDVVMKNCAVWGMHKPMSSDIFEHFISIVELSRPVVAVVSRNAR